LCACSVAAVDTLPVKKGELKLGAEAAYLKSRVDTIQSHFPSALSVDDFLFRLEMALCSFGLNGENSIGKLVSFLTWYYISATPFPSCRSIGLKLLFIAMQLSSTSVAMRQPTPCVTKLRRCSRSPSTLTASVAVLPAV
jgi:hypothetical protein